MAAASLCDLGCRSRGSDPPGATVAVSSTYLESATRELLGTDRAIVALADPGLCPGHFDIRPGQLTLLRGCRLLLRFEFQASLDATLSELAQHGLRIAPVKTVGGMCEPDSYLGACRQVADALTETGMLSASAAAERLAAVSERMAGLTAWARQQVDAAGLRGTAVVTSRHQAGFCRFLGLQVVATFTGTDTASVAEINTAIEAGTSAKIVVANFPEGRRLADALADRLGARVVVFGNFPDAAAGDIGFDALFRDNVRQLVGVVAP